MAVGLVGKESRFLLRVDTTKIAISSFAICKNTTKKDFFSAFVGDLTLLERAEH